MPREFSSEARKLRWPKSDPGPAPTEQGAEHIKARIRWARLRLKLSYKALAKKADCSESKARRWETQKEPSSSEVEGLARALKVNSVWLMFGQGPPIAELSIVAPPGRYA